MAPFTKQIILATELLSFINQRHSFRACQRMELLTQTHSPVKNSHSLPPLACHTPPPSKEKVQAWTAVAISIGLVSETAIRKKPQSVLPALQTLSRTPSGLARLPSETTLGHAIHWSSKMSCSLLLLSLQTFLAYLLK